MKLAMELGVGAGLACVLATGVDHKLHSLRHFHASTLLRAGVHLKVVSTRLGHSSVAITGDIYSRVSPGLDQGAVDDFARAMSD